MIKIALLALESSEAEPCKQTLNALKSFINERIGPHKYQFFYYKGPRSLSLLKIYLQDYVKNIGADIIITFGFFATKIALDLRRKHHRPFEIISWGFPSLRKEEKFWGELTKVTVSQPKVLLPIQILLRLNPDIQKTVIPFRLLSLRGETAEKTVQAQRHLTLNGHNLTLAPLKENYHDLKVNLEESLVSTDAIIATEASIYYEEFALIERLAADFNIYSWVSVEYGEKRHALASVINDFEAVGKALGHQVCRALNDANPPDQEVKNFRKLRINMHLAAEKGIPVTKRLEQQLSQALEAYEDLITIFSIVVNPSPQALLRDLFTSTIHHMRLSNAAHFHHKISDQWSQPDTLGAQENLYHIASMSYAKAVIVTGGKYAYTICKHFKDNDINRPIIYFTNTNEDQSPYNWHNKYSTPEMPIVRISIPPPNLRDQAKLLLAAAPHLRQVCLLVRYDSFSQIPLRLQSDIAQWQSFCMKRNVMPTIRYSPHEKYLEQIPTGVFTKDSGWIVCAENIPYSVMRQMGEWFIKHNVPAVSGSLTWARWFPLTIGIDADAIAEHKLMPVLKRILLEKQSPERDGSPVELRITNDISLEYEQWYRACINEEVAAQLGLDVNAAKTAVKDYKIVPVDYALDTAICMKQFTVEERLAMLDTPAPLSEVSVEKSDTP